MKWEDSGKRWKKEPDQVFALWCKGKGLIHACMFLTLATEEPSADMGIIMASTLGE